MAKTKKPQLSKFAQALTFLSLTRSEYCQLENHRAVAFDSILAAGTKIEEDLNACPHLDLMLEAILRCGPEYVITQLSPEKLLVRSGDFQVYIPCARPESLPNAIPDAPGSQISDDLLTAMWKVVPLLNPVGETILDVALQVNNGTCLATDRLVLLEAWHGQTLPDGMLLPKSVVSAMHKAKKRLKAFGYGDGKTATFWFEDSTWIRTQLYQGQWPSMVNKYLECRINPHPVPPQLFEAYRKVAAFSADGRVYIKNEMISSHPFGTVEEGSALKLPIGSRHLERAYPIHNLDIASKYAELWDENARPDGTYFQGENIRGLITHVIPSMGEDDDIPF